MSLHPRRRATAKSGFTLFEISIGIVIMVMILTNLSMVLRTSSAVSEASIFTNQLEQQASRTMDRIALSLMSASSSQLDPTAINPDSVSRLDYEVSLGSEDGEAMWSDPERIEFIPAAGQVVWSENPGTPDERRVVWSNWIPGFLEGEMFNGVDDNANNLQDEAGLSFTMDGDQVRIHLTLERINPDGKPVPKTLEARVTCRN